MYAEENCWSLTVTVYAEKNTDTEEIAMLQLLLKMARERKFQCGSVGVVPLPPPLPGYKREEDPESYTYVSFSHTDWNEIKSLIREGLGDKVADEIVCTAVGME